MGTCAFCGKSFIYANSLNHHKYSCKQQPIDGYHHEQCPHCYKRLAGNQKFEIHIDCNHPDSENKNFTCAFCGKGFIYASSLNHHKYSCKQQPELNKKKKRRTEEQIRREWERKSNRIAKKVKCDYCDVTFLRKDEITEHYKINHPGQPIWVKALRKYNCEA